MIYRQLPVIEKSQPIAPKYEIKPGAQHQTLRRRKHIYKIVLAYYIDIDEHYIYVRATYVLRSYGLSSPSKQAESDKRLL